MPESPPFPFFSVRDYDVLFSPAAATGASEDA